MKKKSSFPQTKVKNPEPKKKDENWIIWAAWADRITFEEIKEKTGIPLDIANDIIQTSKGAILIAGETRSKNNQFSNNKGDTDIVISCLLYTSPSPRDS